MQMKDLQFRLREMGTTGGSDSDEYIFFRSLGRVAAENENSFWEVSYQASEIPWEKFKQMGAMLEALQICGRSERLDRSAN